MRKESNTQIDVRALLSEIDSAVTARVEVGEVIGDYTIESHVADGGFASVFRGRSLRTGESVAIKVLRQDVVNVVPNAIRRLQREAETLARVDHPAIVKIIEIDEIRPGLPYLVMEWVEGHTLSTELQRRGVFSPDELLGVLEPLCGGLAAAHEVHVVHRDLKPSNVMIIPEGEWFRIKLVDFGIAKMLKPDDDGRQDALTVTGAFLGTPSYMAPEQFIVGRADERTDIYALGIMSFLLLSGRTPFQARNPIEMAEMHIRAAPPRVSEHSQAPRSLDSILERCLAKAPKARYPSVREFLDDVRAALRASFAPSSRGARATTRYLGLHVAATFNGLDEDLDDNILAEIDDSLSLAQAMLESAGMDIHPDGGSALLAIRSCEIRMAEVEALLHTALDLYVEVSRSFANVHLAITSHVSNDIDPLKELRWASRSPWDAVSATQELLEGMQGRFEVKAIPGVLGKLRVDRIVKGFL